METEVQEQNTMLQRSYVERTYVSKTEYAIVFKSKISRQQAVVK